MHTLPLSALWTAIAAVCVLTGVPGGGFTAQPAAAQGLPHLDASRGALLIHGNFCGPGSRGPGYPPIDSLDVACAHHDACSPAFDSGRLPTCACNNRLHAEAGAVARNPGTPASVRDTARFISEGALALPCTP